jgi:hypothetical protein
MIADYRGGICKSYACLLFLKYIFMSVLNFRGWKISTVDFFSPDLEFHCHGMSR